MPRLLHVLALVCAILVSPAALAEVAPLWEGLTKTPAMLQADQEFVAAVKEAVGGDIAKGYDMIMRKGWKAFEAGDQETAIRRFNQATLLDINRGEAYWGFALATHLRGDGLAVAEHWFIEAEKRIPEEPALLDDHGRILDESGEPGQARKIFERVLKLDANNIVAHIGMSHVLLQLGDPAGSQKHAKEVRRLQGN